MGVLPRQAGRSGTSAGVTEAGESAGRAGDTVSGRVPRQFVIRVEPTA
jgi:hypothetical protein